MSGAVCGAGLAKDFHPFKYEIFSGGTNVVNPMDLLLRLQALLSLYNGYPKRNATNSDVPGDISFFPTLISVIFLSEISLAFMLLMPLHTLELFC